VAARPRQPCAWVRCAKGSWRACGVSAAVSDQAWREAAQSSLGIGRACMAACRLRCEGRAVTQFVCRARLSMWLRCQMRRRAVGEENSLHNLSSHTFLSYSTEIRPGPGKVREQAGSRAGPVAPRRAARTGGVGQRPAAVNGGTGPARCAPRSLGRVAPLAAGRPERVEARGLEAAAGSRVARSEDAPAGGRRGPVPGPFGLPAGHSTADRSRLSWSGPPTRTPPPKLYTLLATAIHAFTIHSEADRTRGVQL